MAPSVAVRRTTRRWRAAGAKPDLGRGSHTGGSPQPMRMTLRLCCRAGAGISAVAAPASRRRDRVIVLVQCSVAKRWMSCALQRARQRFSLRGSLRRLSCCDQFRSRSSGRAQPSANAKVRAKMAKDKAEAASARETHASAAPRTRRALIRLRPGDWTMGAQKNLGAAHHSQKPPPPPAVRPGATESSRRRPRNPENTPHALAERRISQRHDASAVPASSENAAQPAETDAHARPCTAGVPSGARAGQTYRN